MREFIIFHSYSKYYYNFQSHFYNTYVTAVLQSNMISSGLATFILFIEAILNVVEGVDRTYYGTFCTSYNVQPVDVDTSRVKVEHQTVSLSTYPH